MKNITFNFNQIFSKLKAHMSMLFWLLLLALLLAEALVVMKAYKMVLQSQAESNVQAKRQVRVNFDQYDKAVERVQQGSNYIPKDKLDSSPFGVVQVKEK